MQMLTLMKLLRILLLAFAVAVFGYSIYYFGYERQAPEGTKRALFHCPMHPHFTSDLPGSCPICGMDLVEVKEEEQEKPKALPVVYVCPMHPQIVRSEPGKCPICGMDLVEKLNIETGAEEEHAQIKLGEHEVKVSNIRSAEAKVVELDVTKQYPGFIEIDEAKVAKIHLRFNAFLEQVFVSQVGQRVRKGQVLARVYSPDIFLLEKEFAEVRDKKGFQELASSVLERMKLLGVPNEEIKRLMEGGMPSSSFVVTSPINGIVLERMAFTAGFISTDMPMYVVADLKTVYAVFLVPQEDMRFVKVGSPVRVRARGVAMEYLGKVDLIYPLVEQDGRKIRVRIVLENKDFLLLGGMVVSGIFEVKKGLALVIPKDALMLEGEKAYVFVEKEVGTYVKRVVKTGEIGPETVEVLEGLSAGEKVVTQANFLLDSESKIRAQIER
jgi:multidrug efflux pump subunit AcrA (membrane-fusion protein)